jgi:hypothetical protein
MNKTDKYNSRFVRCLVYKKRLSISKPYKEVKSERDVK